jgi:hypothetical protein
MCQIQTTHVPVEACQQGLSDFDLSLSTDHGCQQFSEIAGSRILADAVGRLFAQGQAFEPWLVVV